MEITLNKNEIAKILEDYLHKTFGIEFVQIFAGPQYSVFKTKDTRILDRPTALYEAIAIEVLEIGKRGPAPGDNQYSVKINQIKRVREITNCSLKNAKDYVEDITQTSKNTFMAAFERLTNISVTDLTLPWEDFYKINNTRPGF